jgi:hypothetical protein
MRGHIARQQPVGVITPAQHEQARAKEQTLAMLAALAESGRHEEALRGYDEYLKRYPNSTRARAERDAVQRQHDAASIKTDTEITRVARKPSREKTAEAAPPEPPKKLSRWEKIKKWYRGK